jgi:hypothetical protein
VLSGYSPETVLGPAGAVTQGTQLVGHARAYPVYFIFNIGTAEYVCRPGS